MCRKQSGIAIGRLCDKCDGKCPVCDSYVRPTTLVRICDECSFGNYQNKCVVCGGEVSSWTMRWWKSSLTCKSRASRTLSTASNALDWRKTVTAVPKLSILDLRERISSTRRRISGITDYRDPDSENLWPLYPFHGSLLPNLSHQRRYCYSRGYYRTNRTSTKPTWPLELSHRRSICHRPYKVSKNMISLPLRKKAR